MEMKIYFPGNKRVYAEYKGFTIKTDQSVHNGGDGSAPQPFDLFLASIGTCTAAYVNAFCQRRGIDPKEVAVIQSVEKDPAKRMITRINIKIQLPPDFPEKYKTALIKSASQCAVKKHMEDEPVLNLYTTTRE